MCLHVVTLCEHPNKPLSFPLFTAPPPFLPLLPPLLHLPSIPTSHPTSPFPSHPYPSTPSHPHPSTPSHPHPPLSHIHTLHSLSHPPFSLTPSILSHPLYPDIPISRLLPVTSAELIWRKSFSHPIHSLWYGDLTGDGVSELAVLSMGGLHLLQVSINQLCFIQWEASLSNRTASL